MKKGPNFFSQAHKRPRANLARSMGIVLLSASQWIYSRFLIMTGPVEPVGPAGPVFPRGISKLRTGLQQVPELVTLALLPGTPVSVAPTVTEGQQA